MATFTRSELEKLARQTYAGLETGNLLSSLPCFAPEFLWHVPGTSPVSGTYAGADEYFRERLDRMAPLDEWKLRIRRVLANEPASSTLVELDLTASRLGRNVSMVCFHQLRFNGEGRVIEAVGFAEEQASLDEFFA